MRTSRRTCAPFIQAAGLKVVTQRNEEAAVLYLTLARILGDIDLAYILADARIVMLHDGNPYAEAQSEIGTLEHLPFDGAVLDGH